MQEQLPSGDPDNSAQRVERPEGDPQGERSESSRYLFSICYWIPACAGMTEYELIRPFLAVLHCSVRSIQVRQIRFLALSQDPAATPHAIHSLMS
jgi:hypothetical protein